MVNGMRKVYELHEFKTFMNLRGHVALATALITCIGDDMSRLNIAPRVALISLCVYSYLACNMPRLRYF